LSLILRQLLPFLQCDAEDCTVTPEE